MFFLRTIFYTTSSCLLEIVFTLSGKEIVTRVVSYRKQNIILQQVRYFFNSFITHHFSFIKLSVITVNPLNNLVCTLCCY
jgi:hypothetical protein